MISTTVSLSPTQGFFLGHGFPLILSKLVAKIEHFEFFNMAELLPDNIELARKTKALSAPSTYLPKVPKKRELSHDYRELLAWVICFCTYAAIVARKQPNSFWHTWQPLSGRHSSWIAYDNMFRQQVTKNQDTDWSSLLSMFLQLIFLKPVG